MTNIVAKLSKIENTICHAGMSTDVIRAGITMIVAKGMRDAISPIGFVGFRINDSEIKNGIIIDIIIGQIPDWASWALSKIAPTVANRPR